MFRDFGSSLKSHCQGFPAIFASLPQQLWLVVEETPPTIEPRQPNKHIAEPHWKESWLILHVRITSHNTSQQGPEQRDGVSIQNLLRPAYVVPIAIATASQSRLLNIFKLQLLVCWNRFSFYPRKDRPYGTKAPHVEREVCSVNSSPRKDRPYGTTHGERSLQCQFFLQEWIGLMEQKPHTLREVDSFSKKGEALWKYRRTKVTMIPLLSRMKGHVLWKDRSYERIGHIKGQISWKDRPYERTAKGQVFWKDMSHERTCMSISLMALQKSQCRSL